MTPTLEAVTGMGSGPLSERFDEALAYASRHHRQQLRKGSRAPHLTHLMSVSARILEPGGSEDQAIAALRTMRSRTPRLVRAGLWPTFGRGWRESVTSIVAACSNGLDESGDRSGARQERKRPYVAASERSGRKAGHRPAGNTVSDRLRGHSITTALNRAVDELVAAGITKRSAVPLELPVRG